MKLLLADDHPVVRKGLRAMLAGQQDIELLADVAHGEEALEQILTHHPDVAVLDVEMPGLTGVEVARKVRDAGLGTTVVLLSMHRDETFVQAALSSGVAGYVLKEDAPEELVHAIRVALSGETYLSPRIDRSVLRAPRNVSARKPELTGRERDVVRLLARGLTSREVAAELGLTPKTVEGYRARIMDKLQFGSLAELVKYALQNHLASFDE